MPLFKVSRYEDTPHRGREVRTQHADGAAEWFAEELWFESGTSDSYLDVSVLNTETNEVTHWTVEIERTIEVHAEEMVPDAAH